MQYWLMKSEPETFSIEDLKQSQKTQWDGVRNYQARNFMRDKMRLGDLIFFYHSNAKPPGIVGLAKVSRESHPDPTQLDKKSPYFDPRATQDKPIWFLVEITFQKKFSSILSLESLKEEKMLQDFPLLKQGNRLSILPVSKKHWQHILTLAN